MKIALIVLVLLVVLVIGGLFYLGQQSRSGSAPGLSNGQLAACPSSPNCVSSESSASEDQAVDPLSADSWDRLPAAVQALGGTVTRQDPDYLSAEFVSSLFKFTDDVEFRRADDGVHVRSASRVGHSDMGANRARVEALRAQLASG